MGMKDSATVMQMVVQAAARQMISSWGSAGNKPPTEQALLDVRPENLSPRAKLQSLALQTFTDPITAYPQGLQAQGPFVFRVGTLAFGAGVSTASLAPGSTAFNTSLSATGGTGTSTANVTNCLLVKKFKLRVNIPPTGTAADLQNTIRLAQGAALNFAPGTGTQRRVAETHDFGPAIEFLGGAVATGTVATTRDAGPGFVEAPWERFAQPKAVVATDTFQLMLPPGGGVVTSADYTVVVDGVLLTLGNVNEADGLYPECAATVGDTLYGTFLRGMLREMNAR